VSKNAPFGVDNNPTDYSGNMRPKNSNNNSNILHRTQAQAGPPGLVSKEETVPAPRPESNMSYSDKQLLEYLQAN